MLRETTRHFGVIARIRGLPNKTAKLRRSLLELVTLTRAESGCLSCEMIENRCDSTEFTLIEEWCKEEAHDAHFGTGPIRDAMLCLQGLLSGELDLRKHMLRLNAVRYGTNSYSLLAT